MTAQNELDVVIEGLKALEELFKVFTEHCEKSATDLLQEIRDQSEQN